MFEATEYAEPGKWHIKLDKIEALIIGKSMTRNRKMPDQNRIISGTPQRFLCIMLATVKCSKCYTNFIAVASLKPIVIGMCCGTITIKGE